MPMAMIMTEHYYTLPVKIGNAVCIASLLMFLVTFAVWLYRSIRRLFRRRKETKKA